MHCDKNIYDDIGRHAPSLPRRALVGHRQLLPRRRRVMFTDSDEVKEVLTAPPQRLPRLRRRIAHCRIVIYTARYSAGDLIYRI